jgi:hypothetical protein
MMQAIDSSNFLTTGTVTTTGGTSYLYLQPSLPRFVIRKNGTAWVMTDAWLSCESHFDTWDEAIKAVSTAGQYEQPYTPPLITSWHVKSQTPPTNVWY